MARVGSPLTQNPNLSVLLRRGWVMNAAVKSLKHIAPKQYLGFALQPVRLCYHLLTCQAGAGCSMEYLDDVAVHHPGGGVTLEQNKSATRQNPLSDWADDLWKTIASWLEVIATGAVDRGSCAFRLYVTPKRHGGFATALSAARSANDVAAVVEAIKAKLAKLADEPGCMAHLEKFLAASVADRNAVATGMFVISEDDCPVDPIRHLLRATVPPAHLDRLCEAAIGMAKEHADRLIRAGEPPIVDGDAFKVMFRSFVKKNVMSNYLPVMSERLQTDAIDAMLEMQPPFLRQLDLISATQDERVRAVSDLLRSSADKSRWAEAGEVFQGSLDEWDENLVARHGFTAGEIADLHGDKEAGVRGRLLYRRCAQMETPLEGRAVPAHFVHGCFNALADMRRLGWHPDYRSLLDEYQ